MIMQIFKFFAFELALDLVVVAVFLSVSYCLGARLLKFFKFPEENLTEVIFFSFSAGFGLLAFVTFILGHLHLLYSWVFWLLSLAILLLCRNDLINLLKRIRSELSFSSRKPSLTTWCASIIIGVHIFYGLSLALLPEYNTDATYEHLAIGSLYKYHHRIIPILFMLKGEWPHLTEMLHLFATMLIKSSPVNDLINYSFYLSFLFGVYIICRRFLKPRFALLGCAIFSVSSKVLMAQLTMVKEEFLLSLFFLSAFLAFLKYARSKKFRDVAFVVLFLGFATGTKIIYGFFPLIAIVSLFLVVAVYEKIFSFKRIVLTSISMVAFVLLMALPWYGGQIVHHHNFFYPMHPFHTFASGDVSAMGSDPRLPKVNQLAFRRFLPENPNPVQLIAGITKGYILLLWRMAAEPDYFGGERVTISFSFIIIFGFILLIRRPHPRDAVYTGVLAVLLYTLFFFSLSSIRRMLPLPAVMSIVCAYVVQNVRVNRKRIGCFLLTVVFLVLCYDVVDKFVKEKPFGGIGSFWPVLVGIETRRERLIKETYGATLTSEFIDNYLPKNAKLFFYPIAPGYHFNKNYIWGDKLQAGNYIGYSAMKGPEDLLVRLRQLGITHMVVDKGFWRTRPHYQEEEIENWIVEITQRYSFFMFRDRHFSVYQLQYDYLNLNERPVWTIEVLKNGTIDEELVKKSVYELAIPNYSSDYEYEILTSLQSTVGTVEVKSNNYGQLLMKGPGDREFETVAQWNPAMLGGIGFESASVVRAFITPYVKGNGIYCFKWTYIHGPGSIRMFAPKINAYEIAK